MKMDVLLSLKGVTIFLKYLTDRRGFYMSDHFI